MYKRQPRHRVSRPPGYLPDRRPSPLEHERHPVRGIQRWEEYKPFLTKQEVKDRVNKAIRMQASTGIQHVRAHVDINDPKLTAMEAFS